MDQKSDHPESEEVEEAVELLRDDKPVALIAKFKTGHVAVCTQVDKEKKCYVTSRPQPVIYYQAQAFYTGIDPELRVRKIHGEGSSTTENVKEDDRTEGEGSKESGPDTGQIDLTPESGGEETTEECEECKIAIGLGMYLNVCKEMKVGGLDCEDLYKKVISNEITPQDVFKDIKSKATGKNREVLEYIDWLMEQRLEDLEKWWKTR